MNESGVRRPGLRSIFEDDIKSPRDSDEAERDLRLLRELGLSHIGGTVAYYPCLSERSEILTTLE